MLVSIIRHGQTDCNKRRVLQGGMNTELNETGRNEAARLGDHLKNIKFTHIFSSNLNRAQDTVRIVLDKNDTISGQLIVNVDERLRERNFGIFEGKPKEILAEAHAIAKRSKSYPGSSNYVPEGGESTAQVYARAREFFLETCHMVNEERKCNAHILISTHGGVIVELMALFVKELNCAPPEGISNHEMVVIPGNTAVSQFTIDLVKGQKLEDCLAKPGIFVKNMSCTLIHDRSHCSDI